MKAKHFLPLILLAAWSLPARSQNVRDLIISEVLAEPDSCGIVDGYGRRCGWIELFNTSQGTVNFGGCYLTDDRTDLRKSIIPKGDLRTKLGPRQTALIFAGGNGADGTFYAGFTVSPGETVYLVSNDGRTVIDSLQIPSGMPKGMSLGKEAHDLRQREFVPNDAPGTPTPGSPNVSVSVVFSALAILWALFILLFRLVDGRKDSRPEPGEAAVAPATGKEADEGVYAAIAAALDLYLSDTVHDAEPFVITLRPKASAWNDKRQNFRKLPK